MLGDVHGSEIDMNIKLLASQYQQQFVEHKFKLMDQTVSRGPNPSSILLCSLNISILLFRFMGLITWISIWRIDLTWPRTMSLKTLGDVILDDVVLMWSITGLGTDMIGREEVLISANVGLDESGISVRDLGNLLPVRNRSMVRDDRSCMECQAKLEIDSEETRSDSLCC
jgi:hypothetical protein